MIKPITPKLKNYHTKGVNRRFASLLSYYFAKFSTLEEMKRRRNPVTSCFNCTMLFKSNNNQLWSKEMFAEETGTSVNMPCLTSSVC